MILNTSRVKFEKITYIIDGNLFLNYLNDLGFFLLVRTTADFFDSCSTLILLLQKDLSPIRVDSII